MVNKSKEIELRTFTTWLQDEICYTLVKPGSVIELEDAQQNTEAVKELSGEKIYPILVNLKAINSISKEARDHFAMKGRTPGVSAIAMLIKSPVSRIIGNFFLSLSNPAVPTKLFTEEAKAFDWLKELKNSNSSKL